MKSTIIDIPKMGEFPQLYIHNRANFVMLFTEERSGTVVYSEVKDRKVGDMCKASLVSCLDSCEWIRFNSKIILEN